MNVWILFIKAAGQEINARLLFITVEKEGVKEEEGRGQGEEKRVVQH